MNAPLKSKLTLSGLAAEALSVADGKTDDAVAALVARLAKDKAARTAIASAAINAATPNQATTERLGITWRHNLCAVRDDLLFIRQHQKTIAEADEMLTATIRLHKPATVERARKLLPWCLSLYLEHIKAVSLAEQRMDEAGVAYALSSDDWRA